MASRQSPALASLECVGALILPLSLSYAFCRRSCVPRPSTQTAIWVAEGTLLCNTVAAQVKLGQFRAAVEETCPELMRK